VQTGVWLRANETEISAALWVLWLGKDIDFFTVFFKVMLLKFFLSLEACDFFGICISVTD